MKHNKVMQIAMLTALAMPQPVVREVFRFDCPDYDEGPSFIPDPGKHVQKGFIKRGKRQKSKFERR